MSNLVHFLSENYYLNISLFDIVLSHVVHITKIKHILHSLKIKGNNKKNSSFFKVWRVILIYFLIVYMTLNFSHIRISDFCKVMMNIYNINSGANYVQSTGTWSLRCELIFLIVLLVIYLSIFWIYLIDI